MRLGWLRDLLPPVLVRLLRRLRSRQMDAHEWEYVGRSWPSDDSRSSGWNDDSVVVTQRRRFAEFRDRLAGTGPLGTGHEGKGGPSADYAAHNTYMTFAYVLARAAWGNRSLSVLDWGGGLGQYYLVARSLLPEVSLDYHCVDLSAACAAGRELLPEVSFHEAHEGLVGRSFDLVVASSSLQYASDWPALVSALSDAAKRFLFVTRLPVAHRSGSFVVVQRPYVHGYETEYLGWVIDRDELIERIEAQSFKLEREFLVDERPDIVGAPEQPDYRGFLFER